MTKKLIECVPNISEGRDIDKINEIAHVVDAVDGVKLLDIDPGAATNRTVITFVGEPEAVIEKVAAAEPIVEAEATAGEVVTEATPGVVEEPIPVAAKKAVVTVVATVVTAIVAAKELPAATEPPVETAL